MLGLLSMKNCTGSSTSLLVASLGRHLQETILFDFFRIFDHAETSAIDATGGPEKPLHLEFPVFQDESICTMVNENPSDEGSERLGWTCVPSPRQRDAPISPVQHAAQVWTKMQKSASLCRRGWSAMDPTNKGAENSDQQLEYVSKKERAADLKRPPQWCSINEPIEISVGVRNPFCVPLVLKNLRLVAEIEEGAPVAAEEKASCSSSDGVKDRVQIIPVELLVLESHSTQTLRVRVVPLRTGTLRITGLRWELENTEETGQTGVSTRLVHCLHLFQLRGTPLNDSRKNRALGVRKADTRLLVTVVGRRPWIGATLETPICVPHQQTVTAQEVTSTNRTLIFAGQLLRVKVKLKNFGDGPAKYISLVCSKPELVVPQGVPAKGATLDTSLFILSELMPLNAGEEKGTTLLIRAPANAGVHDVNMMLEYCSEPSISTDLGELFFWVLSVDASNCNEQLCPCCSAEL